MTKCVLITGTSSGFGKLGAELLASRGYRVYATMRNTKGKNAAVATELGSKANVTVLDAEATDTAAINNAVAEVITREGRLDVLINNAGFFSMGIGESFTEEDLRHIYDVNVIGPWRFIRAALPQLRNQGDGLIITVSSSLARFSSPFMTAYASAKHALEGLLEGMKYELKPFGIDLAFIEPGVFPTQVFNNAITGSESSVNSGYGSVAGITGQIRGNLNELFASGHASNPILVAEAMLRLIETEKGRRPLRNPVDPAASAFTERANAAVAVEYAHFLRASGMGNLLD